MMTGLRFGTWFWITAAENVLMHLFSNPWFWLGLSNGLLIITLIMWRLCHVENRWLHNAWQDGERQEETTSLFIRTLIGEIEKGQICYAVMEKAFYRAHGAAEAWITPALRMGRDNQKLCQYISELQAEIANYKAMAENGERRIYELQAQLAVVRDELEQLQLFIVDRAAS